MTHALKTWPNFYKDIQAGYKNFEVRKFDRPFKPGDKLILQEWDPATEEYTGKEFHSEIGYILHGGNFGIEKGYVVLGLKEVIF